MEQIKKIGLSASVIMLFMMYSIHEKNEGATAVSVVRTGQTSPASPVNSPIDSSGTSNTSLVTNRYKDGTYTGNAADAYYGDIQVQARISHSKLTDVVFLKYPNDRHESIEINTLAIPYLKQEAIQSQNATVDIVSGATDSSQAFRQSLASALIKAK